MKIFVLSFYNFKINDEQVVVSNERYIFKVVRFVREETFYCFPKRFILFSRNCFPKHLLCFSSFFGSPYKHLFMNINTFISLLIVSFLVTYGSIFKKFFPSFWPDHSSPLIFLIYEGYLICLYKPQWNNRVYNWQASFFIIF